MKLAILGGSFNPVHIGHLFLADAVLSGLGYDRVILVPAFESPFKIGAEAASPADRVDMLSASIAAEPRLAIDDCEISREGVSYTIDTLNDIIERYRPDGKPGLILGDDLASSFHRWRSPDEISELADIIIARRLLDAPQLACGQQAAGTEGFACNGGCNNGCNSGEGPSDAAGAAEMAAVFPYPHKALNNEIINVSSRMVREKIRRGEAWRYLVPQGAKLIIEDRFLYGFSADGRAVVDGRAVADGRAVVDGRAGADAAGHGWAEQIARLENDARLALGHGRFVHSRNTALLSWDLCRRFGLPPQKGYLAGIAHDLCKSMSEKELIRMARLDGRGFSKLEQKKPGLLHGRAAAVLLRKKYGIDDPDILESIQYHTTGTMEMCALAKVVYIADKIEISRAGVDPALRSMGAASDLETLFRAVLDNTVTFLKSRRLDISYGTRKLLAAMQKRKSL